MSQNLFRLVSGICNKFLLFDLRVLVLACLTNSFLKYRGALAPVPGLLTNNMGMKYQI